MRGSKTFLVAVILMTAIVVAGGAAAGTSYVITSTHQIKPNVLRQLHGARGPEGPQGQQGTQGTQGAPGPSGVFSTSNVTQIDGLDAVMCPNGGGACAVGSSVATCPSGSVVLGGGWSSAGSPPVVASVAYNKPVGTSSWQVIMASNTSAISQDFYAVATCATSGSAASRTAGRLTSSERARVASAVAAVRAEVK
jgi:hypothetical protein